MKTLKFHFDYSTAINGTTKELSLKWDIRSIMQILYYREAVILTTDKRSYSKGTDVDLKFDVMIKITEYHGYDENTNLLLKIYYSTPVPVKLQQATVYDMCNGLRGDHVIAQTGNCDVPANQWHLIPVKSTQFLYLYRYRNEFIYNSCLSLNFQFIIQNESFNKSANEDISITTLNYHFENLLKTSNLSDVTLKSLEGVELPAHKLILTARSDVFKAHFDHGTKETFTNIIETSFETKILEQLLHYIYTDKAPKVNQMPADMLRASDFYQLNGLKMICEKALHDQLRVENAIKTLMLADTHSAENLKMYVIKFINKGNIVEVMKTKGWGELKSPTLIKSIFEHHNHHLRNTCCPIQSGSSWQPSDLQWISWLVVAQSISNHPSANILFLLWSPYHQPF